MMKRLDYIDLAKGFMILLVVAGHIVDCYLKGAVHDSLFGFIYSFHMPLFFLLSGFVMGLAASRLQSLSFFKWLWNKIQTLLIPFFIWSLFINCFVDPLGNNTLNLDTILKIFVRPDLGMWFLASLFCIQVVCYPLFRYNKYYLWIIPIAFLVVGNLMGGSFFYFNVYHYASFLAGYLFFLKKDLIMRVDVATAALIVFVIAEIIYPNPILCTLSAGIALLFVCRCFSDSVMDESGGGKSSFLYRQFKMIGQQTMAIYLIHFYLVYSITGPYIEINDYRCTPILVLIMILAYGVSIICVKTANVISLFPLLNWLLLGKRLKK